MFFYTNELTEYILKENNLWKLNDRRERYWNIQKIQLNQLN